MTLHTHPQTTAAFEAMGALDHLERIRRLDEAWQAIRAGVARPASQLHYARVEHMPEHDPAMHYDLIYAGGGLGLIHAAVMAKRYGLRVLVFDQGQVGCAHREWNISREELHELVASGLCSWDELQQVIMAEYETGVVRFYAGEQTAPADLPCTSVDTKRLYDKHPSSLHSQALLSQDPTHAFTCSPAHPATQACAQELWLPNVLNLALDAGALLMLARRVLEEHGGQVRDHCRLSSLEVSTHGPVQVALVLEQATATPAPHPHHEQLHARLLIDAMGSSSPLTALRFGGQPFAAVCPTVGTVVSGLEPGQAPWQHNPQIGDILLSVADAQRGQQYMWEGFPGRGDELTIYLFYYDTIASNTSSKNGLQGETAPKHATTSNTSSWPISLWKRKRARPAIEHPGLLDLFEDYFTLLPTYKRPGPEFRHLKPVYGYIPARHSMRRQEAPLLAGVLPIGDAAAQQSPLTFCGFGSHIRNLGRTSSLLHSALRDNLTEPEQLTHISAYQANVSMNWIMSRFMQPWRSAHSVNELQNIFLDVLKQLGLELSTRFFRDQMRWGDYHRMILGMFRAHPRIVLDAWQVLGTHGIQRWIADYLRYSREAVLANVGRRLGPRGREALLTAASKRSPALGLAMRARIQEWRVMGWLEEW